MATKRFHSLDELVMGVKAEARQAAVKAAGVFKDRVALGTFHVTPAERLRQFLAMPPGARDQLRETLGDEAYMQYAQMQLEAAARQRDMGPTAAAALFEMLGIFGYPGQEGARPPPDSIGARNTPSLRLSSGQAPAPLRPGSGGLTGFGGEGHPSGEGDEGTQPELLLD